MCTPNIPDVNRQWSSIDIFIFSNGQQNTPPRKYHLQYDDLNMWDSTLNHLATSQYGSKTPGMELFSIDGKKIDGPLELVHGLTYVAVLPPEEFIQADYYTYLMKASRSWQKRQRQLCTHCDNLSEKDTNCANTSISSSMNNLFIESNQVCIRELSSIEVHSKTDSKPAVKPEVFINNNQKHFPSNPTIIKNHKNVNKEGNTNFNQPLKRNNTPYATNVKNQRQNSIPITKSPKVTTKTKIPCKGAKDNNILYNKRNISKAKTDNATKKNTQNGNVPINHRLERLGDKDTKNVIDVDPCNCHKLNSIGDVCVCIPSKTMIVNPVVTNGSRINENASLETDTKQNTEEEINKDQSISIKCGGVLNLRLSICVNDYETSNERNNAYNLKITQPNSSLHVTEKASQVSVDFDINVATLNKLYRKDGRDPNIIILRPIKEEIYEKNIPLGKENNNIFYLLPAEKSCKCEDEKILITNKQNKNSEKNLLKSEHIETGTSPAMEPKSGGESYQDVQTIAAKKTTPPTMEPNSEVEPYQDVQTIATKETTPLIMEPNSEIEPYQDAQTVATKKSTPSTMESNSEVEPYQDVQTISKKTTEQTKPKNTIKFDKYTQTEWSNTLVEARYQQNGHYSLHLPPLALVKNHNQLK